MPYPCYLHKLSLQVIRHNSQFHEINPFSSGWMVISAILTNTDALVRIGHGQSGKGYCIFNCPDPNRMVRRFLPLGQTANSGFNHFWQTSFL